MKKLRWLASASLFALSISPVAAAGQEVLSPCELEHVETALCGTIALPEDTANPAGRSLATRVVLLPATGPERLPDPMFFLAGGPGVAVTTQASFLARTYSGLHERRDLVFVDQRGTGPDSPLRCEPVAHPDRAQSWLEPFFFSPVTARRCLEGIGDRARPELYTTTAFVADLERVRELLGYQRVNLEASSYGVRVALEYMRRHPEAVRTAVLLGASPTSMRIPESFAPDTESALEATLRACADDAACNDAFPDLGARLDALLTSAPYTIERPSDRTGAPETVTLSRTVLVDGIRRALYSVNGAARLPALVHAASEGDLLPMLEAILRGRRGLGGLSLGLYLAVTCAEDVPFIDQEAAREAAAGTMLAEDRLRAQTEACAVWLAGEPPADFHDPVRAEVPALVLNGSVDPAAPPRHGRAVAEALPNATFVELAETSHAMGSAWEGCVGPLVEGFVSAGSGAGLDTSCARSLTRPPFQLDAAEQVTDARRLTLDDIRAVRSLSSPRLSPSGDRVVYAVSEPETPERPGRSNLWLVDAEGDGESVRLAAGPVRDRSPHWTPDGRSVAFLSDRGEGSSLWRLDVPEGAASESAPHRLTPDGLRVLDYAWSPAGDAVALLVPDGRDEYLDLLDPGSGTIERVLSEPGYGITFDWSPDGSRIVYSTQREAGFYAALESDLFLLDVRTGTRTALVERRGVDRTPRYSPDGATIAFVSGHGAEGGLLPNLGVALVPADGGPVDDVGRAYDRGGFFEGPTRIEWAPDGRALYYNVSHGEAVRVVELDLESRSARPFTDGPLAYEAPDVAMAAPRMTFLGSSYGSPAEVHVTDLAAFEPERLTDTHPEIRSVAFPQAGAISWAAPDGTSIHGLLVKPPDYDPARRYPLVTILHGGPASSVGEGFWGMGFYNPYRDDLLAANGFLVLQPNPRGSGGFGEEFRRAAVRDWGRGPLGDVLAGVDYLVEEGLADPERLGIAGWSYGGYLTAWAITQTDRFAAASVGAGVFDLESHFGQAREQMLEYFGAPPWVDPEAYERDSPSSFVGSITTPTQVLHGDADTAVSFAQGQQLVASLMTAGVPYEFHAYQGQGHTLRDPEMQDDAWEKVLAWFERWLNQARR